jgi:hypothetical protein
VWLEAGQAIIGDYKSCNFTEKEYRDAKDRLVKSQFIKVKRASKGTIVTLLNIDAPVIPVKGGQESIVNKGRTEGGQEICIRI